MVKSNTIGNVLRFFAIGIIVVGAIRTFALLSAIPSLDELATEAEMAARDAMTWPAFLPVIYATITSIFVYGFSEIVQLLDDIKNGRKDVQQQAPQNQQTQTGA